MKTVRGEDCNEAFRAPGSEPPIRITPEEEQRLAALRDWLRVRDEQQRERGEKLEVPCYTGDPNYLGWRKKKKEKDDPNGYMRTIMYDGSTPGIMLYRRGGVEIGASSISKSVVLNAHQSLDAVVNRPMNDEAVRLLLSSLPESTQAVYLKNWKIWANYCRSRQITTWLDPSKPNWDREI